MRPFWLKERLDEELRVKQNFDIVRRDLIVQNIEFSFYFVDGFIKDEIMEKMMEFFLKNEFDFQTNNLQALVDRLVPYVEVDIKKTLDEITTAVLSGSTVLIVEGFDQGIVIDLRTYPTRGMQEPDDDKVLRGARDGFVETLIFNTALIRRRIRDKHLCMEFHTVSKVSKSDVVLCFMSDRVNQRALDVIRTRIEGLQVESLTMAQESLAEALVEQKWYNPFPKVRYTERPDTAASNVLEGKIILLIDNSPSILILPTHLFDFVQEAQDYYLPPITGTYLRIVRIIVFFIMLLITPVWYFFNSNPDLVPSWLAFSLIEDTMNVPILLQFLILEFGIDALKLASLNTPSSLSSSFSIIGALILGDFAVSAGWFAPEVILYMAFVALANFTSPSYELGYALKFMRVLLLLCIGIFPRYGIILGFILIGWVIYTNKTITKGSYLYPLIPFHGKEFKMIFLRKKLQTDEKEWKE